MSEASPIGAVLSSAVLQHDVWRLVNEGDTDRGARFDLAVVVHESSLAEAPWAAVEIAVPAGQVAVVGLAVVADEATEASEWGVEIGHLLTGDDGSDPDGHRPSLLTNALSLGNVGETRATATLLLTVQPGGGDASQYGLPYADRLTLDPGVAGACALRFTPLNSVGADSGAEVPRVVVDWLDGQQGVLVGHYGELGDPLRALRLGSSIASRD